MASCTKQFFFGPDCWFLLLIHVFCIVPSNTRTPWPTNSDSYFKSTQWHPSLMNKTGKACLYFSDISFDKAEELFGTNILTCTLNLLFGVVTFVANSTILLAIKKKRDLHTPSFVLLGSLATSDLLVGLVCQPLFVAFKVAELERNLTAYCWLRLLQGRTAWTTSGVSLLTVGAVSVDRLLALTLHLRYETLVTVPRVLQVTFLSWVLSMILNVALRFLMTTNVWL